VVSFGGSVSSLGLLDTSSTVDGLNDNVVSALVYFLAVYGPAQAVVNTEVGCPLKYLCMPSRVSYK
jgi:hypothetical protein